MATPFHSTRWSLIQDAAATDVAQRNQAWAEFDQIYRKPLVSFIQRSGWPEDRAEDLLQSFLAKIADRDWLKEADPERCASLPQFRNSPDVVLGRVVF